MRSTFPLAALVLLFGTTAGCPEAAADLAGKWLRLERNVCVTSFKDGAKIEDKKCFQDRTVVSVTKAGHEWIGIACPTNSSTPLKKDYSKTETMEETIIGRMSCSTDGARTTLKWTGTTKDFYLRSSLTSIMKIESVLSFETGGDGCRLVNYVRTVHQVNSEATRSNGDKAPGNIADYKYQLDKGQCRVFSSEKEARALD
ncbi:MAG: hypothetical protein J0H40_15855 [Rhizobiales bacterium]|nr:hypothetical protein [Hyphomicrobiales bacterium]